MIAGCVCAIVLTRMCAEPAREYLRAGRDADNALARLIVERPRRRR
jgi:hypothetical protein